MASLIGCEGLRADDMLVLKLLSCQGAAKLNHDLAKGITLSAVLKDLTLVFHGMLARRQRTLDALAPDVQMAITKTRQFLTSDEMLFLNESFLNSEDHELFQAFLDEDGKITKRLDLSSSAEQYLTLTLQREARRILRVTGVEVVVNPSPMLDVPVNMVSATMLHHTTDSRLALGLSPVVTWFDERKLDPALALRELLVDCCISELCASPSPSNSSVASSILTCSNDSLASSISNPTNTIAAPANNNKIRKSALLESLTFDNPKPREQTKRVRLSLPTAAMAPPPPASPTMSVGSASDPTSSLSSTIESLAQPISPEQSSSKRNRLREAFGKILQRLVN